MQTVQIPIEGGVFVTVSAEDESRVAQHRWHCWGKYPRCPALNMSLHHFILGQRPDDVPEDFVADHANRNTMDASRPNLRWVSVSFNMWNHAAKPRKSCFRGVQWEARTAKWVVQFKHRTIGAWQDEREAFVAYAGAVIREWPLWAPSSDWLVGDGLLTGDEVRLLVEAADVEMPSTSQGELPRGVKRMGEKFVVSFKRKWHGVFATQDVAEAVYNNLALDHRSRSWDEHVRQPIPRDDDGNAIIPLGGQEGVGKVALVPDELFHVLTWEHSWTLANTGYPVCNWGNDRLVQMHVMVFRLLHPFYVRNSHLSIDHIDRNQLNNLPNNLRLATRSEQQSNKGKRANATSQYPGVFWSAKKGWCVDLRVDGKRISRIGFATEQDAFQATKNLKANLSQQAM